MRNKSNNLILTGWVILFATHFSGQQSVNAAGGDNAGSGGSVSYTIGQVDFTSYEGPTGQVNLGVQQPFESLTVPTVEQFLCLIYPNPTSTAIYLSVTEPQFLTFSYVLYDSMGKIFHSAAGLAVTDGVQLDGLIGGAYFIVNKNNLNQVLNCRLIKICP